MTAKPTELLKAVPDEIKAYDDPQDY